MTAVFISELVFAANTIESVTPPERRRLIERGIATVRAQRELLTLRGNVIPMEPPAMRDMEALAVRAEYVPGIGLHVSAGMLLLAEEIRRLRILIEEQPDT